MNKRKNKLTNNIPSSVCKAYENTQTVFEKEAEFINHDDIAR